MKEELARQAAQILDAIAVKEKRLEEITKTKEDVINGNSFLDILCILRENSRLFEPTIKDYVADVLDKAIEEKKEIIGMAKSVLDQL